MLRIGLPSVPLWAGALLALLAGGGLAPPARASCGDYVTMAADPGSRQPHAHPLPSDTPSRPALPPPCRGPTCSPATPPPLTLPAPAPAEPNDQGALAAN